MGSPLAVFSGAAALDLRCQADAAWTISPDGTGPLDSHSTALVRRLRQPLQPPLSWSENRVYVVVLPYAAAGFELARHGTVGRG